jgi:hypothetical protein
MTISASRGSLTWAHLGDLHITRESEPNYRDFQSIVDSISRHLAGQIDFCVFPGDNADDGAAEQGAIPVQECRCRINDDPWKRLHLHGLEWEGKYEAPSRQFKLTVEATDSAGATSADTIIVAAPGDRPPRRVADGSDADALGAWPERHLLGTRLGPNRNGRKW